MPCAQGDLVMLVTALMETDLAPQSLACKPLNSGMPCVQGDLVMLVTALMETDLAPQSLTCKP